ncbi:helix-hairpin-helix domain-containing protein [Nocardia sp. NPDC127579]|uniref:helix-hairpin-helix domain-containing protein n=1 Tax=Nocardia sp. NPDC127579 TaxID=3345402 RepID=UPI0036395833
MRRRVVGDPADDAGSWDLDEIPEDETADDVGAVVEPGWLRERRQRPSAWDRFVPERFHGIRLDPGRRGALTLLGIGLLAIVVAAGVFLLERPVTQPVPPLPVLRTAAPALVPAADRPNAVPPTPTPELVVSVVGLVHRPGLVHLPTGSRVADALAAAGGPTPDADLTGLNLAQRLTDSDQVMVGPAHARTPGTPQLGSGTLSATDRTPTAASTSTRLNLNTATASDLESLPGVGPVTARAIIHWRTANGPFTDVAQLAEVDGIGPARLARLRDLVQI